MKLITSYIFASLVFAIMLSCGTNKQEQQQSADTTSSASASDLMKESPPYDPSKIDPAAEVVTLMLKALGNSMADMHYDQKELRVKAGSTVKLQFSNEGTDAAMVHNFVLIDEGTADKVGPAGMNAGKENDYVPKMKQVLVFTKMTPPKEKTEITFPAPEKGTYDFICTYPGHYQKMNGKFIVE
jgi:azurin